MKCKHCGSTKYQISEVNKGREHSVFKVGCVDCSQDSLAFLLSALDSVDPDKVSFMGKENWDLLNGGQYD